MLQKSLFRTAFILLFSVAILFWFDTKLYLSWNYWWFDKVMHFSAGVIVGISYMVYRVYFSKSLQNKQQLFASSLIAVLFVGVVWEIFELYIGVTLFSDGSAYIQDTLVDIVMDILGGFSGVIYSLRILNKNE